MTSKKNIILILASMGTFVEALDIAIINLTIPSIQQQFKISSETVQWLQTLYVLFFGGFLIIGGKLSDVVGRKKTFIIGASIFMLSSLGAGLSQNFEFLAGFRALQGLGAALIMPAAMSIVSNTFTETKERGKAISIFSAFAAIGSGSGLSAGGIISTVWGWHWVFLINVPILAIVLILSLKYLDWDKAEKNNEKTDVLSGLMLVVGLLVVTYGVHQLADIKQQLISILLCAVVGVGLLILVYRRLKIHTNPLIDLSIFRYKSIVVSNIAFLTLGAIFIGFLFLVSLLLQKDMSYSAAEAGLLLVPFSIVSTLVAKFGISLILNRLATPQMGVLGMLFMLAGCVILLISVVLNHSLFLVLLSATCISGIGMTICFTSLSILSVQDVPANVYGVANSLTNTMYFLGAGIGLSVVTLFMQLFPSDYAVSILSLFVLSIYALSGLSVLVYYVRRKKQISPAEIFVKKP